MDVYMDESGNTGGNLFDRRQPFFYLGCLITKNNLDEIYNCYIQKIERHIGDKWHAKDNSIDVSLEIIREIKPILKRTNSKLLIYKLEKSFIALKNIFELLFDPENDNLENIYLESPMKYLYLHGFAKIIGKEDLMHLWSIIIKGRTDIKLVKNVLERIKTSIGSFHDDKFIKVMEKACIGTLENLQNIPILNANEVQKKIAYPNTIAFINTLSLADEWRKRWNSNQVNIYHDEQDEFEKTFKYAHDIISDKSKKPLEYYGEKICFGALPDSTLNFKNDDESIGIKIIDTVLYLYKQLDVGKIELSDLIVIEKYLDTYTEVSSFEKKNFLESEWTRIMKRKIEFEDFPDFLSD